MLMRRLALILWFLAAPVLAMAADTRTIDTVITTKTHAESLRLELAATQVDRETGLMNRDSIGTSDGMLFLFPKESEEAFWMKNTRIPLDIIFIDARKKITRIAANATPQSLTPIPSGQPVIAVIELDGGRAAKDGIDVGDRIAYDIPAAISVR